ncbi:phosphodiester glycosidase family protein [Altererythrobacter sp. Root672]|uniref:phosphodiester glycosidase family protein n=1 Tax=Altererythrobacter sp. Root672 TaxID=1736584 RepID=UPI0006FF90E3|nr:phosphodiester glycosidase family protein [Altererythrobacter sp. Root672]KRA83245.1 hypothetical protein ASD76_04070 [Altererythrobacter sp. Root672]
MKRAAALLAFAIAACGAEEPQAEPQRDCAAVIFEDAALTHCIADPTKHVIRTALDGRDGKPARSFAVLAESLPDPGQLAFAMNAGMYDEDGNPIGYYVEHGERRHTLNRNDGAGNFHLKPNGVFYGSGGVWQIRSTDDFAANVSDRPEFATQSGPMLVIGGKLHPGFDENGQSRKIRNAVGIDAQGRAHFVISETPVSFGKLARYFRDRLKTPNALFLDGSVSQLWDPGHHRMDEGVPLGPFILIERQVDPASVGKR